MPIKTGNSLSFKMNTSPLRGIEIDVEDESGWVRILQVSHVEGEQNKLLMEMSAKDFQRFQRLVDAANWRVQDFTFEEG